MNLYERQNETYSLRGTVGARRWRCCCLEERTTKKKRREAPGHQDRRSMVVNLPSPTPRLFPLAADTERLQARSSQLGQRSP